MLLQDCILGLRGVCLQIIGLDAQVHDQQHCERELHRLQKDVLYGSVLWVELCGLMPLVYLSVLRRKWVPGQAAKRVRN